MLVRLLYASRAASPIDDELLEGILGQSRTHNAKHGVSGVLCVCHTGNVFMQVLEGGRTAVNALYQNIVRDDRHRDVTLLAYGEVGERDFVGWRMGRVDLNKVNLSIILKYSALPTLDPFAMPGATALALLRELMSNAVITGRGGGA